MVINEQQIRLTQVTIGVSGSSSIVRKPKVLLVGPYPPPYGGIAMIVRDMLESPLSTSVDLRLMRTLSPKGGSSSLTGDSLARAIMDFYSLIKELARFRPNIVHIQTSYDWGWPKHVMFALVSKMFGAKVILHIHGHYKLCKEMFPKTKLRRFIFTPKTAFNLADHIFTLSDGFTNNILACYPGKKVTTIYNCIMMAKYLDANKKVRGERVVVSYIGRLEKRKGIRELLDVVERVSKQRNDITFKIAGIGPEKQYVEDWICHSAASSALEYLGFISEEDKIRLLRETDIFVLQSTNEGNPISILEAIASGCAIISTPVGSIADVVFHMRNGLMIEPEDPDALHKAILQLCEDRRMLERMQRENLTYRSRYSMEKMSENIAEIYASLVGDYNI